MKNRWCGADLLDIREVCGFGATRRLETADLLWLEGARMLSERTCGCATAKRRSLD
jgi:hypothetical protein